MTAKTAKKPKKPRAGTTKTAPPTPTTGQLVIVVWDDAMMDADESCPVDATGTPTGNPYPTGARTITPGWFIDEDADWIRLAWWHSPDNDTETYTTITRIPRAWTTRVLVVPEITVADILRETQEAP